jgi:peptidoglycan/xylan/chitin deacetylase (PgdA/CDA1 family)
MHIPIVPSVVRLIYPSGVRWNMKDKFHSEREGKKHMYITFDDGPVPEITPLVLNILSEFNAKATFFCVGDNVRKYPELYNRVIHEGHATGNHTYSHLNGFKVDDSNYINDIERCNTLINSTLFRPPFGRIRFSQIKELRKRYDIILWSVLTGDYNRNLSKEKVLEYAIKYSSNGSIVVFHDSIKAGERMLYALPKTLEHFGKLGFSFDRIE